MVLLCITDRSVFVCSLQRRWKSMWLLLYMNRVSALLYSSRRSAATHCAGSRYDYYTSDAFRLPTEAKRKICKNEDYDACIRFTNIQRIFYWNPELFPLPPEPGPCSQIWRLPYRAPLWPYIEVAREPKKALSENRFGWNCLNTKNAGTV